MNRRLLPLPLAAALLALATDAGAHGVPPEQVQALVQGGPLAYLASGAVHMLTGYDHLLFLFGVMFFLTRFADIAKFVTVFTLGHSLTLLTGTLLGISANYYLVDAVIALSVIYKGFDNLDGFRRGIGIEPPNLLCMVAGFGLIHGFGLATRLQQLPLPEQGLVARIVAFNVGVELGQIAGLVVMVALLSAVRRSAAFKPFTIVANYGLIVLGGLLFLMQMHGYLHTRYPDELGFSSDLHEHDHQRLREQQRQQRDNLMPSL